MKQGRRLHRRNKRQWKKLFRKYVRQSNNGIGAALRNAFKDLGKGQFTPENLAISLTEIVNRITLPIMK